MDELNGVLTKVCCHISHHHWSVLSEESLQTTASVSLDEEISLKKVVVKRSHPIKWLNFTYFFDLIDPRRLFHRYKHLSPN